MKIKDLGGGELSPINLKEYVKLDINTSNYGSRWELFDITNTSFHQSLSSNDKLTNMKKLFDNNTNSVYILDIANGGTTFVIDMKNKYNLEGFIFYICPRGNLSIDIYGSNDKTNYIKIDSSSNFINGLTYIDTFLELYFDNNKIKYRYYKLVFGYYTQGIWLGEIYTYVQRPDYYCFKNNSKLFNINNNNEVNCDINNKTNMSDSLNQLNIVKASEKYSEIEIVKV